MRHLLNEVRPVVESEKTRAQVNFGRLYASPHEGFGVMAEELFEANNEVVSIVAIKTWLMTAMHDDDTEQMLCALEEMAEHAALAACEYIQVAAVAQKMIETLEEAL